MEKSSINYYRGVISQEDILALTNTVLAGIPYGLKTSFPDNPLIKLKAIGNEYRNKRTKSYLWYIHSA